MSNCCNTPKQEDTCHSEKSPFDYLLWGSLLVSMIFYALHFWLAGAIAHVEWIAVIASSVFSLVNIIWWGILLGIVMLAMLSRVPREFVVCLLGTGKGYNGIVRATIGGVLLDLCSHGILMVGAKLYERGASLGQVMAFLIASPWNSFSLAIILIALLGFWWAVFFMIVSMVIALITGMLFDYLEKRDVLPTNPYQIDLPKDFQFWPQAKLQFARAKFDVQTLLAMLKSGILESRMVVRWILFGILLASGIRALIDVSLFQNYFGPTLVGLSLTLLAATIIEVCSEGSAPIAADLFNRAKAPGNSFAFLMAGVSTDYTEIMVLKEATKSWKIALFLPLLTVPQILLVAWLVNLTTG